MSTYQYFIKCEKPDGSSELYTRPDWDDPSNQGSVAVYSNTIDMAVEFARALSIEWPQTTYTILRYVDGLPVSTAGTFKQGVALYPVDIW